MKRYLFIFLSWAACVTLVWAAWSKGREARDLRDREHSILNGQTELPVAAEPIAASPDAETEVPSTNISELLSLRGEVVRLELRKKDLMSARAENERLKLELASMATNSSPELPPDYIRASKAQDRGYATPQATMETFFWTIQNKNEERLLQCFTPDGAAQVERGGFMRHFFAGAAASPGFRFAQTNAQSPDLVTVQIEPAPGIAYSSVVTFKLINGEWKIESF